MASSSWISGSVFINKFIRRFILGYSGLRHSHERHGHFTDLSCKRNFNSGDFDDSSGSWSKWLFRFNRLLNVLGEVRPCDDI